MEHHNADPNNYVMTKKLAVIFAIASGMAIGNLYWAQPLLAQITASFDVETSSGGLLITATQVGYATGIFLIVPLGDLLPRKKLIVTVMMLSVAALLLCAKSPGFEFLALALASLGLVTVSGQIFLPLAGDLSADNERGGIVGIVTAGITTGILIARVFSGFVANLWGWRSVYLIAACMNLVMIFVILKIVPDIPGKEKISYGKLLAGVFRSFKKYPEMLLILLQTTMAFGIAFNMFWTALTFLLSGEPFGYSTLQIGRVSLTGIAGAVGGIGFGKLQDKGWGTPALGIFIVLEIVCLAAAIFAARSIILIVAVTIVFSLAVQGVNILSQTRLFALSDTERSRLNTAYIVTIFIFCALGSALASVFWNIGGWTAVMLCACGSCCVSLAGWALQSKIHR